MTRLNQCRRRNIGYQQMPMVQNMQDTVQPSRMLSMTNELLYDMPEHSQSGEGVMETFRGIYDKSKKLAGKASEFYSSELGTHLRNLVPDSDETARPGFPGEKHAILQLKNGKNAVANYMGPGTNLTARLERGDPPRTFADKVAKRHDIDYAFASTEPSKEKQLEAIRKADRRMIAKLSANKDKDAPRNIHMGLQLIRGKTIGEDLGLLSKEKFAGELKKMTPSERLIALKEREKLEQQGFGMNGGYLMPVGSGMQKLPGEKLKMSLLKKRLKTPRESKNLLSSKAGSGLKARRSSIAMPTYRSMTEDTPMKQGKLSGAGDASDMKMKMARLRAMRGKTSRIKGMGLSVTGSGLSLPGKGLSLPGKGLSLPGKGLKLAGQGDKINLSNIPRSLLKETNAHFASKILPDLFKDIGIKLPVDMTHKIVDSVMSSGTLTDKAKILTSQLLPLMAVKKTVKLSGGGLKLNKLSGKGLSDVLAVIPNKLADALSSLVISYFKGEYKRRQEAKKRGMKGKGTFWEDFKKGFLMVFKPGLQILGAIAGALGQPEIAVPLEIISGVL